LILSICFWASTKRQSEPTAPTGSLFDDDALDELAVVLVEFAEDIHAGIGLWQALENYQSEFFGVELYLNRRLWPFTALNS
jgi:hypothetical protein